MKNGAGWSTNWNQVARRNINNLRYADDIILIAEREEELKSLLMKVKEESEKVGLKLNIQKTKIMTSGPITSWQIDEETMEIMTDFMATHSSTLAWKIPWTEEPGKLWSMGLQRVRHDWATSLSLFTFLHWRRKWQPTPVFLPGEPKGQGSLVGWRLWGHKSWTRHSNPNHHPLHISNIRWVIIYNLDVFLSQFWTSPLFHVQF